MNTRATRATARFCLFWGIGTREKVGDSLKEKKNGSSAPDMKKTLCLMALFIVIAAASVYTVAAQSMEFSAMDFLRYVKNANWLYLVYAVVCMLGFILFEGLAVLAICRVLGYRRGLRSGIIYSASDIYFSAITPSATGGQPVSMWFMIKDGVSGTASLVALVVNVGIYTVARLLVGVVALAINPEMFFGFTPTAKTLIVCGFAILVVLAVFFVLILYKERWVHGIAAAGLKILSKLRLVKYPGRLNRKLQKSTAKYKECSALIGKHKGMMLLALLLNLLQRMSQITVTTFACLAVGGDWGQAADAWLVQAYTAVGSNCVPVPGAMGVSDYILLDGLDNMMARESAVHLELLARSISFYSMIVICGIAVLWQYLIILRNKRVKKEGEK